MSSESARSNEYLRHRLLKVALEECHNILKPLKKAYPRLSKVSIVFEDAPSTVLLQLGVRPDCDYYYDAEKQEIVIFLFNAYEKNHEAAEFRRRVRDAVFDTFEDMGGDPGG